MGPKEMYQKEVEEELEQAAAGIQTLKTRAAETTGDTKGAYDEQVEALESIQTRAEETLEELRATDQGNWKELQPRLEGILSELRNAVSNLGVSLPQQGYRSSATDASSGPCE